MDNCAVDELKSRRDGFEQILRTYIPAECRESRIADLLVFCRRTGCRDVMIFTSLYDGEISFKSPEAAEVYTKNTLIPVAEALRAAGVRVHLNVTQTLGHVFFPNGHKLDEYLVLSGIPMGFTSTDGAPYVASGDDLLAASEAEIDLLLHRGMMLDVPALEALTLRGYGDRIGVDCSTILETEQIGYE